MEVAVMADLHRVDGWRQRAADVVGDRGSRCQQAIGQGLVGVVESIALFGQEVERVAAALNKTFRPGRNVRGADRLGRELRNVGPARQRALQLAGPARDLPQRLQIGRKLRAFFGRGRARQHALVVDEAAEIGAGDRPGVALVLDEPVRDGERASLFAFDQFDRAQQIRDVPVAGMLDQEASDLDLGVNAFVELAEDLHDATRIHDHGGVGLLAVRHRDLFHFRLRHLLEGSGRQSTPAASPPEQSRRRHAWPAAGSR